jgi:hypothetical protein
MSKCIEFRINFATETGVWHGKATRAYLKEGVVQAPEKFLMELDPEIKLGQDASGKETRNYRLYGDSTFAFIECSYFEEAEPALIEWRGKKVLWCRPAVGMVDAERDLADRCPA